MVKSGLTLESVSDKVREAALRGYLKTSKSMVSRWESVDWEQNRSPSVEVLVIWQVCIMLMSVGFLRVGKL